MISFQSKESQESSPTPQFESINSPVPTTRVKKRTQEMKGLSPPVPRAVGYLGQRETGPGISGRLTTLGLLFFFNFFFFGCAGSSLLLGPFSSCGERVLHSSCAAQASYCSGFFCWGARAPELKDFSNCSLQSTGLVVVAHGPSCSEA